MRVRYKKNDLSKWNSTRESRIRPEGMTRAEWRALGSARRQAIRLGMWAALKGDTPKVAVGGIE